MWSCLYGLSVGAQADAAPASSNLISIELQPSDVDLTVEMAVMVVKAGARSNHEAVMYGGDGLWGDRAGAVKH